MSGALGTCVGTCRGADDVKDLLAPLQSGAHTVISYHMICRDFLLESPQGAQRSRHSSQRVR